MILNKIKKVVLLTRLDSSLYIFAVVFLPLVIHGETFLSSFLMSFPLLTTSMGAFALNDINDVERDRTNHPDRPLVQGDLSTKLAMMVYFVLLAVTLLWMRAFVGSSMIWPYVLYLVILTNYNFVIDEFPSLKNFVVSIAIVMPVVVLDTILFGYLFHAIVIVSLFLFVIGREMLMDICDADGDGPTLSKVLGEASSQSIAFFLHVVALVLLWVASEGHGDLLVSSLITIIFLVVYVAWKFFDQRENAIRLMKLQLIAGIEYLI